MADGQTNGWLKSQYAGLKQFPGQRGMWGAAKPGSTVQPLKGVTGEPPLKGDSAESIQKYVDMDRPTAVQSDKAPISGEKSGMRDPDMTATPQAGTTAPLGQPQRMSPKDLVAARYGTPTTWRGRAQQMFGNAMDKLNPISNAGAADDVPQPNNPVPKPDNPTTDNRNVQSDAAKEADAYNRSVQAGAGMRGTVTPSVTNPKSIPASTASSGGTSNPNPGPEGLGSPQRPEDRTSLDESLDTQTVAAKKTNVPSGLRGGGIAPSPVTPNPLLRGVNKNPNTNTDMSIPDSNAPAKDVVGGGTGFNDPSAGAGQPNVNADKTPGLRAPTVMGSAANVGTIPGAPNYGAPDDQSAIGRAYSAVGRGISRAVKAGAAAAPTGKESYTDPMSGVPTEADASQQVDAATGVTTSRGAAGTTTTFGTPTYAPSAVDTGKEGAAAGADAQAPTTVKESQGLRGPTATASMGGKTKTYTQADLDELAGHPGQSQADFEKQGGGVTGLRGQSLMSQDSLDKLRDIAGRGSFGALAALGVIGAAQRGEIQQAQIAAQTRKYNLEIAQLQRQIFESNRNFDAQERDRQNKQTEDFLTENARAEEPPQGAMETASDYNNRILKNAADTHGRMQYSFKNSKDADGKPYDVGRITPAMRQDFALANDSWKQVQAARSHFGQKLRDLISHKEIDDPNVFSSVPKSVEPSTLPGSGGWVMKMRNGNTVSFRDYVGGGINFFGPDDPYSAKMWALAKPAMQQYAKDHPNEEQPTVDNILKDRS